MLTQYPPIKPFNTFMLNVDALHTIYVEQCGNPQGIPAIFVHGGPGGGCSESDRCWFDPARYHIILFDQRGSGRSTPHACLENNTTAHLVADMEMIRQQLNLSQWLVFGGSWGSTLSLAYAEAHPKQVLALILRGVFLGTANEFTWFYGAHGAANIFPDYYEDFLKPLRQKTPNNHDIIAAYYDLLTHTDENIRLAAAKAWALFEARCASLRLNSQVLDRFSQSPTSLSLARIECHYFLNRCFLKPDQLLKNIDSIASIPCIIVQGRYDMICPPNYAWQLHNAWPASTLHWIEDAGHSSSEPGTTDQLIQATQKFAEEFSVKFISI